MTKTGTSSCSFYDDSKKYTWLQYKKRQIQAPGTPFSIFGDDVGMEGGHGNCCRFATLTGVHQGAHICLAKYWMNGKVRSYSRCPTGKNCEVEVVPIVDLIAYNKKKLRALQHRWHVAKPVAALGYYRLLPICSEIQRAFVY